MVFLALILYPQDNPPQIRPEWVLVGLFYTLLPDVDSWNSVVRILLSAAFFVLYFLSSDPAYGLLAVVLGVFLLVSLLLGHRGFLHTLAAGVLLSAPLFFLDGGLAAFAFFGYVVHLAVDNRLF
jgi:membrane-bound metal-dependent hydrolase YbcI (DUF457 family)